jgi:hypothetical protein
MAVVERDEVRVDIPVFRKGKRTGRNACPTKRITEQCSMILFSFESIVRKTNRQECLSIQNPGGGGGP